MEKREQVFVSSTYEDLKEARDTVIFGLLEADCFPAGMELFPASNESQWELIKTIIDDSDYYLLIIAGRYGSVDPNDGKSYTEKEFDYAVETGKPIVVFAHKDPGTLPANATDQDNDKKHKLDSFRDKACTGRTVKFWTSKEELPGMAAMALNNLRKFNPAVGWVRGDQAMTPEKQAEFAELTARLLELESERITEAPLFDDLSDGADAVKFTISASAYNQFEGSYYDLKREVTLTWNQIFAGVAPTLMTPSTATAIDSAFETLLDEQVVWGEPAEDIHIPVRVFETVRLQLIAGALIERPQAPNGTHTNDRWVLTPRGRDRMFALRALRGSGTQTIM